MNHKTRNFLIFFAALFISSIALGQDSASSANLFKDFLQGKAGFLTPPATDKSISYLSQLFGTVGGVLHGTSGQAIAKIFNVFNMGVIVIATCFATFTVVKSVLGTAQDGQFMGRKEGSQATFLAVRTSLGVGVLAPVFGGYSAIQVLMMWVVVHGVGFADAAWDQALIYLKEGGQIYRAPKNDEVKELLPQSNYILKAQICSIASEKSQKERDKLEKNKKQEKVTRTYTPVYDKTNRTLSFPGGVGSRYEKNACGSVTFKALQDEKYSFRASWGFTSDSSASVAYLIKEAENCSPTARKITERVRNAANARRKNINSKIWFWANEQGDKLKEVDIKEAKIIKGINYSEKMCQSILGSNKSIIPTGAEEAMKQMVSTLRPSAKKMIDDKNIKDPSKYENLIDKTKDPIVTSLIGAAADFINISAPYRATFLGQENAKRLDEFYENARLSGWITAGAYYYDLGNLQRKLDTNPGKLLAVGEPTPSNNKGLKKLGLNPSYLNKAIKQMGKIAIYNDHALVVIAEMNALTDQDTTFQPLPRIGKNNLATEAGKSGSVSPLGKEGFRYFEKSGAYSEIVKTANDWLDSHTAQEESNPILALQTLGQKNMETAVAIYLGMIALAAILGVIGTTVLGTGPGAGLAINLFASIAPLCLFFVASMFATGAVFMIYLPLVPFLLFTFGAIGWIITVIESMAAAPLVALGLTHPEGHDLLGKSEQAIMLMLGVFLRPVLMVIGLISGMALSFIGVRMLSLGFQTITTAALNMTSLLTIVFLVVLIQIVYCLVVVAVINQAFSLIYHVPDKVLTWIGAPSAGIGKPEGLAEVKQGAERSAQEMGSEQDSKRKGLSYQPRKKDKDKTGNDHDLS